MKINKQQLKVVFEAFSIDEDILKWEELVHIENTVNEKLILKQYFRISTNRMSYILKLLSLPMCSNTVLEIQSRFSELYRTNGVPTPKRFVSKNGMYLMNFLMEEKEILISLEEDAGDQLLNFSSDTIVFMGNLLGKMHAVSIKKNCHFRPGNLYCEFREGQTTYLPLWKRTGTDFLPQDIFERILELYQEHMIEMKKTWDILPRYTVQSDMYRMNLTVKDGKICIIDYDRVGDEVLLADMLVTWFRFRFDPIVRNAFENLDTIEFWEKFLKAYETERPLTEDEKKTLIHEYAVIGAVFGTKMLADAAAGGDKKYAAENLKIVLDVLEGYGLQ